MNAKKAERQASAWEAFAFGFAENCLKINRNRGLSGQTSNCCAKNVKRINSAYRAVTVEIRKFKLSIGKCFKPHCEAKNHQCIGYGNAAVHVDIAEGIFRTGAAEFVKFNIGCIRNANVIKITESKYPVVMPA